VVRLPACLGRSCKHGLKFALAQRQPRSQRQILQLLEGPAQVSVAYGGRFTSPWQRSTEPSADSVGGSTSTSTCHNLALTHLSAR
jgi:hypothetical protein